MKAGATRVGDLIAGATWTPPRGATPQVTVILPTYSRAANGRLARCLETLRAQTFADFELLVVDDASVDGTAGILDRARQDDPRIGIIRHVHNIGLPAISTFEAFVHARGDAIFFAFDDNEFEPRALEGLVAALESTQADAVYGHIDLYLEDPYTARPVVLPHFGTVRADADVLRSHNVIPNNAVLVRRALFERVGWLDPHIVIARVCDWDLWRRIARITPIVPVDVAVGREFGPVLPDSIGQLYPISLWAIEEWTTRAGRTDALVIDAYLSVDVAANPEGGSPLLRQTIAESADRHRMRITKGRSQEQGVYPRILVVARAGKDAARWFSGQNAVEHRVRVIDPAAWSWHEMIGAQATIFIGDAEAHRIWIETARLLGVPAYVLDRSDTLTSTSTGAAIRVPPVTEDEGRGTAQALDDLVAALPYCGIVEREMRFRRAMDLVTKLTGIDAPLAGRASLLRIARHRMLDPLNRLMQYRWIARIAKLFGQ